MSYALEQTIPVCTVSMGSWQISLRCRPLTIADLTRRYDRAAPKWRRLMERIGFPGAYQGLFTQFIRAAALHAETQAPLRVLDCGVGTGTLALAFARAWVAPVRLHAIDVSEAMIDQAQRNFHQAAVDATFKHADIRALPYPSNQFDLVMSAHVLEHLPSPVHALEEMHRVLKPGGWLVVCFTRESVLGRYIQLKWRTHCLNSETGEAWLNEAGFESYPVHFAGSGYFGRTSIHCIGRKPNLD